MEKTLWVLGGNDAEMSTIAQILVMTGEKFVQPEKGWGDHKYGPEELNIEVGMGRAFRDDQCPADPCVLGEFVFVECEPKDFPRVAGHLLIIDHHGKRSAEKPAVMQVIDLLKPELSSTTRRWVELIAANDVGFIPSMVAIGATAQEIERVRTFDRACQGITPGQEAVAIEAIAAKEVSGRLTIIRMEHSKCATVTDRFYGQYDQLLVLSQDGESNFYGDGALCASLFEKFQGWNGGSGLGKVGENAFWGSYPSQEEVMEFILQNL